jgi:bifunctional non-homologous end joining protein LigD
MNRQLSLDLGDPDTSAPGSLPARLPFALATPGGVAFDDAERFFEPWWPGAHAHVRVQAGTMEVRTEHLSDPLLAFPELATIARFIEGDGVILEGTLMALDDEGRPDIGLLRRRLAGRPEQPAEGAFVASDLLFRDGSSLARRPFVERRRQLAELMADSRHGVVGRGLARDGTTLARASASLGLEAISARRLDGRWHAGASGDDWLRLRLAQPPTRPTRPFLVLLEKLPLEA